MQHWKDSFVYHIYPLGFCGAEEQNDFRSAPVNRFGRIEDELPRVADLGCNTLYLGPVFESGSHGYDTADYLSVDRRLGTNADLTSLVERCHEHGISVLLDGVFNHVGREFWAFRDLRANGAGSSYSSWFKDIRFDTDNRFGDGFTYLGWEGTEALVALDLTNRDVVAHLLHAVNTWITDFGIDGLRLDVAYLLDRGFIEALRAHTRSRDGEFVLLGEVIHGDYTEYVSDDRLDSVTNYECYKGMYSAHNDRNLFEIAHSLNRQFGDGGLYEGFPLYSFVDNHDVDRIASALDNQEHLRTVYALMMTMPGVPSVYYGSEYALRGARTEHSDRDLRPAWDELPNGDHPLRTQIRTLANLRAQEPALRLGDYRQLSVASEQLAFSRTHQGTAVVVMINIAADPASVSLEHLDGGPLRVLATDGAGALGQARSLVPGTLIGDGARDVELPVCGYVIAKRE